MKVLEGNEDTTMNNYRLLKGVKIVALVIVATFVFGFVIMHLWNWLMPAIFGLPLVTFWQALGLLLLSKLFFGGFHRHHGGRGHWKQHMKERWENMTPEDREKFRAAMRGRRGCRPGLSDEPASEHGQH
jgi:chromate transport protein ChrA